MSGMAPEINFGFSASMKADELERRVATIEALLRDLYNFSNRDTFPPDLTERLREFAYNRG